MKTETLRNMIAAMLMIGISVIALAGAELERNAFNVVAVLLCVAGWASICIVADVAIQYHERQKSLSRFRNTAI